MQTAARKKVNNKLYYFPVLLFCLLCFPSPVYTQSSGSGGAADESILFLEIPSVYSASKYEQKITEAPSSVSIITADEIRKYGYRNFAEILRSIRGFFISNDRNYSYLGIRGFSLPSDYNDRVLILVDGIRVNDNIYDSVLLGNDFPLETDLIDRIEVVRGPGSSLYGSNAFFAVINVLTRPGRDLKGFEISGEAGTNNTYKTRLSFGDRLQQRRELLLSASYFDSDGNERLFYEEFDAPETNNGVATGSDSEKYKNLFAKFTVNDFTLQGDYHHRKKWIPTSPWETIFNHDNTHTIDESYWIDLKYEHAYPKRLNVLARINYNYYKYYGWYPYACETGDDTCVPPVVVNKDSAYGKWLYGELQANALLTERHRVTAGADYHNNIRQHQKTFYSDADPEVWGRLDDRRDLDNWALFIQDEISVTDGLLLHAGVRNDQYQSFGNAVSPRAAIIYDPFKGTTFKAVYSRAFRAPSVYELYYNDVGVSAKANPDLKPETINTYELIYEQYLGKYLRGTVAGFHYKIEDLIRQYPDPADGLLVFNNVDTVTANGMELEVGGKSESGFEGWVSYTYQKTENRETGDVLTNSPEHLAKANLIVPLIRDRLFLGMEEQYTGRRRTLHREKQEALPEGLREEVFPSDHYAGSYFITNATLYAKNINNLQVSAGVYNLFDRKYADPGAGEHLQDTIEQDGRTFRLKLTYSF
ncbi:MAG: TonB-dependent receptor [Nitrospirae bacterium]|nr:TonB-dependent receptor [Nitrospirota bacterium]